MTSNLRPLSNTGIFALKISDSVASNLTTDLAALVTEIDDRGYTGIFVTASTTDPTNGLLTNVTPGGFNLLLTITDPTLDSNYTFFGFDLTQFNANSDVLTASAIAVVPEPASISLLTLSAISLLTRRWRCNLLEESERTFEAKLGFPTFGGRAEGQNNACPRSVSWQSGSTAGSSNCRR